MRKLLVLIVVIALAFGGYAVYWHKMADNFKAMVEQSIASINEGAANIDKSTPLIRYEAIETTGFPLGMTLKITKPIIDLPLSGFLLKLNPMQASAGQNFHWIEEMAYSDGIAISGNITGNDYILTLAGEHTEQVLLNNAVRHKLISESQAPATCHLKVQQTGAMPWVMQPIFTNLETFLSIFREADCGVANVAIKDASNGAELSTADEISFSLSNQPGADHVNKLGLSFNYKNAKATPAMDVLVADINQLAYTLLGTPEDERMPATVISAYGSQNFKMDVRYDGPTSAGQLNNTAMQLHFDVGALNLSNNIFNVTFEAHLATVPSGNDRSASFTLKSRSEATPAYDQLLAQQMKAVVHKMMKPEGKLGQQALLAQQLSQMGTADDIVNALLPRFSSFGKSSLDIDAGITGKNDPRAMFRQGKVTLSALNWITAPYGLEFKGSSDMTVPGKMPADLTMTCLTCDALVTDLGNYALRVQALLNKSQKPDEQRAYVTPELIDGLRKFLHGIAESSNAKDLVIHIVMKDTGAFTVSGKQLPEVLGLFSQTIAPYLPRQQAPGAAAPAAPAN